MTNYIKVSGSDKTNFLRIDMDYSKGGYNYFTYKQESRGYYLHISPVYRENRNGYTMESYAAFSGIKVLLSEVTRKSNKAESEALKIFETVKDKYINYILDKYNLTLEV